MAELAVEREALLWGILADPANDAPRLVYADWLDEHAGPAICGGCLGAGVRSFDYAMTGLQRRPDLRPATTVQCPRCSGRGIASDGRRERAEFIRIQCELAVATHVIGANVDDSESRTGCDDISRTSNLRHREQELLLEYAVDWLRGLVRTGVAIRWRLSQPVPFLLLAADGNPRVREYVTIEFSRGFVQTVRLPLSAFLRCADELFTAQPVTAVDLDDLQPFVDDDPTGGRVWQRQAVLDLDWPGAERERRYGLPDELYARLKGPVDPYPEVVRSDFSRDAILYADEDEAWADLSAACVTFGRERAGLRPLTAPILDALDPLPPLAIGQG